MIRLRTAGLLLTTSLVLLLLASLLAGLDFGSSEPALEPSSDLDPFAELGAERIQVEVLNAAGVPGLARSATEQLRESGFDVVFYGNASRSAGDSSVVLARRGDLEAAWRVAEAVGIDRALSAPDTTLFLDVTVILGRDWRGRRE